MNWLSPWEPVDGITARRLEKELRREVAMWRHPLSRRKVRALGRRSDCDDVLYFVEKTGSRQLAVVHLTFSGHKEPAPDVPWTVLFDSVDLWITNCMQVDHAVGKLA